MKVEIAKHELHHLDLRYSEGSFLKDGNRLATVLGEADAGENDCMKPKLAPVQQNGAAHDDALALQPADAP
jgi:hypothetical protein